MKRRKKIFSIIIFLIILILLVTIFFTKKQNINIIDQEINQPTIKLYLHQEEKVIEMGLEDYIQGALAAEMPASFEIEALKAQAVTARTYAVRKIIDGKKYPLNADLSDDYNTCQAYISMDEFYKRNPNKFPELIEKLQKAVIETNGIILVYKDGSVIDALYHSTCGGMTESAKDVWGNDVPYLKSVECNYCNTSRHFSTVAVFSVAEFNSLLGTDSKRLGIEIIERSSTGRTKKAIVNGRELFGERIRSLLNLPSSWFSIDLKEDKIIINNKGYGHGVGMCQYGANGMAVEGSDYREILQHYYQNTQTVKIAY